MKKLLCFLLFSPIVIFAQKRRVLIDSAGNHGLLILDTIIIEPIGWNEAKSIIAKYDIYGWRLPTIKEQKEILSKTIDYRNYGIVPAGYYFASLIGTDIPNKDSLPAYGRMFHSYEARLSSGENPYYKLFLVKPF